MKKLLALGVLALALALVVPARAADPATAPAASADAYGLYVDAQLTPLAVAVNEGPIARASQDAPPNADEPAQGQVLTTGPHPEGGQLVQSIGVLTSTAAADDSPTATATSQAASVALLAPAGSPMLSVGLLRAESTTNCTEDPSGTTVFTDIQVAGQAAPTQNPGPNFELAAPVFNPLGLRVILNEQHATADGRGLVVNAIHIYQYAPALVVPLFTGDIVVGHAMSTVNCPNGAGSTGGDNDVMIVKDVDSSTAEAGDDLTYTATVQNKSTAACPVNRFVDHLPSAFEYVSTSGDFGTEATTVPRPGGGSDIVIEPADLVIAAGGSATQTFVVKVKDDADPGVYFNNVELFCGNLGNWVKGLDAPVEVVAAQTTPTTTTTTEPPAELGLASTGGWGPRAGAILAGLAALLFALRRRLA